MARYTQLLAAVVIAAGAAAGAFAQSITEFPLPIAGSNPFDITAGWKPLVHGWAGTGSGDSRRPVFSRSSRYIIYGATVANRTGDLDRLGSEVSGRIRATLQSRVYPVLRVTPRQAPDAARLRDWDPPTWRIRIGSWRIFYESRDDG